MEATQHPRSTSKYLSRPQDLGKNGRGLIGVILYFKLTRLVCILKTHHEHQLDNTGWIFTYLGSHVELKWIKVLSGEL